MGIWSVFTFLLFYFKDVIRVAERPKCCSAARYRCVLAVPQHHRRPPCGATARSYNQITSWIMAVCAFYFALIAFYPSLTLIVRSS